MISSVGSTPFPFTRSGNELSTASSSPRGAALALTAATAQRSVEGQIQLTTKEGDTVTISAHADASVTYAHLRGHSADGRFSARYASLEASQELSIQVQGDLSEQEMAEISKVVKAFFHELKDAFRGRGSDVGEVSEAGDGATTLANFSVNIESTRSVSVVSLVARPLPEKVPAQPLPPGIGASEPAVAADGDAVEAAPLAGAPANGTDVSALTGRLVSLARRAEVVADKLDRALDQVFRQFARTLPSDGARALLAALQQGVKQGLAETAPPKATPDTLPVDVPATA